MFLTRFLTHLLFSQKFVFEILLFNFQGSMLTKPKLRDSFAIISHEKRFVNPFFQFFSRFSGLFSGFVKNDKRTFQKEVESGQNAQWNLASRGEGMHAHGRDAIQRGALIPYKGGALDSIPQQVADSIRAVHEWKNRRARRARRKGLPFFRLLNYLPVLIEFS